MNIKHPPLLGFVAFSGTGKTTLLTKLIPLLKARGLHIGMIKHAHHNFDIDHPGKDSYELRKSGANQMLVASRKRWALIVENTEDRPEPKLDELVNHLDQSQLDLILVEGFKHEHYPKIELHRSDLGHSYLFPNDKSIIAIACDVPPMIENPPEILNINEPAQVAVFITERFFS